MHLLRLVEGRAVVTGVVADVAAEDAVAAGTGAVSLGLVSLGALAQQEQAAQVLRFVVVLTVHGQGTNLGGDVVLQVDEVHAWVTR